MPSSSPQSAFTARATETAAAMVAVWALAAGSGGRSTTEQYSDKPAGTIIAQNPAAGSTVKVNSRVSVTVSAGPEPEPEVPEEPASSAESSDSASSSGDWWSGLVGGSSSSGSSSTGSSPLTDWWTSLLS